MSDRLKILIVDDREENLFALEKILNETGAQVIKALNGNDALAATLHHDFALAILDVHMPGMSGFELADHLRSDHNTRNLPIIFLTATFAAEENTFEGYKSGAVDYIIKPFNPDVLIGKVRVFLELASYRKQLEDRVRERTERLQHINQVLLGIRDVNQLIVREQDERRLIREVCSLLVRVRGFHGAWVAVVDSSKKLLDIAQEGFHDGSYFVANYLESRGIPPCANLARETGRVVLIRGACRDCAACPLATSDSGRSALVTSLDYEGSIFGFMGVAVPAAIAVDEEEQSLFQEVAGDIAYALHNIQATKERLEVAEALRESEQRYRAVFNTASVGIDLVDRDGNFLEVNSALSEFLGYTRLELQHLTVLDTIHPDDRPLTRQMCREILQGTKDGFRFERRYIRKDGTEVWGDTSVSVIRDADGKFRIGVGAIRDITEQKKSEEARILLEAAVEQAGETMLITDAKGTIVYANPSFERTTGYSREEAMGNSPKMFGSGRHDYKFYSNLWKTIASGLVWRGHFTNRRKDGSLFEEEATISPVRDRSGNIVNYVAVKRDVTKEISLQKQLFKAQKMESIGTLAGGMAHDFNNLLTVIQGYSELMLSEKEEGDPVFADLSIINLSAKRGADLVKRILTFSRQVESSLRPVNLNEEVQHAEKLLYHTIPKMIDIELRLSEDLSIISADSGQIEQIILNLAVNARDAMPGGGTLRLETKNVTLDEEYCRKHVDTSPGDYVCLSVSDTGSGMDEKTSERIFEPFFTTKKPGEGTGLGLAMVFGIVKAHGGHVTCESKRGTGTTFKLHFPVAADTGETGHPGERSEVSARGTETILVVDDEDFIRELGARVLSESGYLVKKARNGEEALKIFENERSTIALVILDLIMPEMGGAECLAKLLEMDPHVKVIIASGFVEQNDTGDLLERKSRCVVKKPFQIHDLLRAVRRVLDEP